MQTLDSSKLRGAFYTPPAIARFLTEWATEAGATRILEPSAGEGVFLSAIGNRLNGRAEVTAIELDQIDGQKLLDFANEQTTVFVDDFFAWFLKNRPEAGFDAVVGNPPFIRYQYFDETQRTSAFTLMKEEGLHPTKLTNAWLPFVVASTKALRIGGRIAFVLPAELLQVMYARELREYLTRKYSRLIIVSFRKLVFPEIQEETVLLMGVREDSLSAQISFIELDDIDDLGMDNFFDRPSSAVDLDHAREKWTQYFLDSQELALVRAIETSEEFDCLGRWAEIDVGIVTGRNEFFVQTKAGAELHSIEEWCQPLVSRSAHLKGQKITEEDWIILREQGAKCLLVQLGDVNKEDLPLAGERYVDMGERAGFHLGYKCRIRLPKWWKVPSAWVPDGFMLRQIHDRPRIIANQGRVTCTDTIHRVRTVNGTDVMKLSFASLNSVTAAFAEIRGRSYGGGVLELEPTEAESLPFPKNYTRVDNGPEVDHLIRAGKMNEAIRLVDQTILGDIGLDRIDIERFRGIQEKLAQRRYARKRR